MSHYVNECPFCMTHSNLSHSNRLNPSKKLHDKFPLIQNGPTIHADNTEQSIVKCYLVFQKINSLHGCVH